MSVYYDILTSCQTAVQALGLTGIANAQIVVRKLPKATDTLETLPQIAICPAEEPEQVKPFTFEGKVDVVYPVELVLIAAGNRDYSANLDAYLGHREKMRRAFQRPTLTGASTVWDTEITPDPAYDRARLNSSYEYLGMRVLFHSIEQRDN